MRNIRASFIVLVCLGCIVVGVEKTSFAQVEWIAETSDFTLDENWDSGAVPDGEQARISNGGTATLDEAAELAELRIGQTSFGGNGALELQTGAELFVSGLLRVGRSDFNEALGFGRLSIDRGAEAIALNLTSGGDPNSEIVLGAGGDSGTATLAVDERATLSRNLRIVGPNVSFEPLFLDFTSEHTLIAEITGPEHSTINVLDEATLNDSALHVDFNGYTPAFGDSWTLIDGFFVEGQFSEVTATGLPPGAGVFATYGEGGENGEIVDLSVGTRLTLAVDRSTGSVSLQNRAATESVQLSGYAIEGINGADSSSSTTLAPESSLDLGEIYQFNPSTIGEVGPAIEFQYESGSDTIVGDVEFSGPHNNVVLLVDPDTGAAAVQNQSNFDIDMDGYLISSLSGSLDQEAWSSIQAGDDWITANPSPVHLAELSLSSSLRLSAQSNPIAIGAPFDSDAAGVQQDLAFEFHLVSGGTIPGVVEYGTVDIDFASPSDCNMDGIIDAQDLACILSNGGPDALSGLLEATGLLPGDLDGSGDVAFADFLVLSTNFGSAVDSYVDGDIDGDGSVAFSDFLVLSTNFGQSSAAAQSVPEPSALMLAGIGLLGLLRLRSSPRLSHRSLRSLSHRSPKRNELTRPLGGVSICYLTVFAMSSFFQAAEAQTLTPVKQVAVSDTSDREMIASDLDAGPLDDTGDIVARERRNIEQDNLQIRTFIEFDLSSITPEAVANPNWSAKFLIDFVTRLNTVNDMQVVVGRVLDTSHPETEEGAVAGDSWTTEPGSLPLFEWGRSGGESTDPEFDEDRLLVVENAKTDPFGTREVDVTSIVADWVNGTFDNNGFSVAGGHDEFQGAGLANARLVVGTPGDFDGNGTVDFADFLVLANNFASHLDGPVTAGDIDFDGDVDLDDFGQFKSVFVASQGIGEAASVPEPAGLMLMIVAIVSCLIMRSPRAVRDKRPRLTA